MRTVPGSLLCAFEAGQQYNILMEMSLFLLKLTVSVVVVLALSVIAERVTPRIAGIVSGYPAGIAINLFFFGYEISPAFAAESALYTAVGLLATLSFIFFYYLASLRLKRNVIFMSSLLSFFGYLVVVWGTRHVPVNYAYAVVVPVVSLFLFLYLFRRIRNSTIAERVRLTFKVLLLRSLVAAGIVLIVTSTAHIVGPEYAGLFAAFPSTLFPLMLIIHATYDVGHVHTIIKNYPIGLGSLIVYSLAVSLTYQQSGIVTGTLISFAAATVYLIVYVVAAALSGKLQTQLQRMP
jgi:hypothetical protein